MSNSTRNTSNAPDATTKHHKVAGRINQKHNHGMSSKTTKRRANNVSQIQEAAAHQTKAAESSKVAKPAESTESAECTEPGEPAKFVEPVEYVKAVEPAEPIVPNEPAGLFVCLQSIFDSSLPPLMYHLTDISPEVALAVDIAVKNLTVDPVINQQSGLDSIPRQSTVTEHESETDASESDISSSEPASDRYEADGELTSDSDKSEPEPEYDTDDYIPNTDSDSDSN